MERNKLLKWIKVGGEISTKNSKLYNCPNSADHYLSYTINIYKEFNKKEIILKCKTCNEEHTITIDMLKEKDEEE